MLPLDEEDEDAMDEELELSSDADESEYRLDLRDPFFCLWLFSSCCLAFFHLCPRS